MRVLLACGENLSRAIWRLFTRAFEGGDEGGASLNKYYGENCRSCGFCAGTGILFFDGATEWGEVLIDVLSAR